MTDKPNRSSGGALLAICAGLVLYVAIFTLTSCAPALGLASAALSARPGVVNPYAPHAAEVAELWLRYDALLSEVGRSIDMGSVVPYTPRARLVGWHLENALKSVQAAAGAGSRFPAFAPQARQAIAAAEIELRQPSQ